MTNSLVTPALPLADLGSSLGTIIWIVQLTLLVYVLLDLARNFITPAPNPVIQAHQVLGRAWEPILRPIQNALPPMGGLDLSPLVVLIGLWILGALVSGI